MPGVFGVFYYRSANAEDAGDAEPVPAGAGGGLQQEFAAGATPVDVCARTVRVLRSLGARHFYFSNLPQKNTAAVLKQILELAGRPG